MHTLRNYTLDYLKKNKTTSIAIIVTIIIATIMLSAVVSLMENQYHQMLNSTLANSGDWHSRFSTPIKTENVKYLVNNPKIEEVMLTPPSYLAKIDEKERPFIIINELNSSVYKNMHQIKERVIEGRLPERENEILISKQFFDTYPNIRLGDTISVPTGIMSGNLELKDLILSKNIDNFTQTDTKTLTIVGKLDKTSKSYMSAYFSYGYFDDKDLTDYQHYNIALKFTSPRDTYNETTRLATVLGLNKDNNGKYPVVYNSRLLTYNFVFSKDMALDYNATNLINSIIQSLIISFILVMSFVFIIFNAFAVSSNSRIKQLSMFKSIGATPKQIKKSIMFEAIILSIIGIPIGLFIGIKATKLFWILISNLDNLELVFKISPLSIILAAIFAFVTVCLSAAIPARRAAKTPPIVAIKSGNMVVPKRRHKAKRKLSIERDIAMSMYRAYKKSYRTSIISMTLAFLLISVFLNTIAISESKNADFYAQLTEARDITFYIQDGNEADNAILAQIDTIPNTKKVAYYSYIRATMAVPNYMQSDELLAIGGFNRGLKNSEYNISKDNDEMYRINTKLIGISDDQFNIYCNDLGIDYNDFYNNETIKTIAINTTRDTSTYAVKELPFLNIYKGDIVSMNEYVQNGDGNSQLDIEFGYITDKYPLPLVDYYRNNFFILEQVMPLSEYYNIVNQFSSPQKKIYAKGLRGEIKLHNEQDIPSSVKMVSEILDSQYSDSDYSVSDRVTSLARTDKGLKLVNNLLYGCTALLILIGIANAFSTVYNNMQSRKREFAILKSVGLSQKQFTKVLFHESLNFAIKPIAIGIPIAGIITAIILRLKKVSLTTFLPYAPITTTLVFIAIITFSIGLAYYLASKKVRNESIVEAIKDELV